MVWIEPTTLRGTFATLEPLGRQHHDDLVESVQDGELWKLWYTFIPEPEKMEAEIERRLELQAKGTMMPAIVDNSTRRVVGMSTYMNVDSVNRRVEIGSTWYRKSAQRTGINTDCKLRMLTHAFEELRCVAVEFRTHFYNHQSRNGIERLGAKLDGILRNHMISANGTRRDTCVYSIIENEWPATKANLEWKLNRPREVLSTK